jgi:hypothetical protein
MVLPSYVFFYLYLQLFHDRRTGQSSELIHSRLVMGAANLSLRCLIIEEREYTFRISVALRSVLSPPLYPGSVKTSGTTRQSPNFQGAEIRYQIICATYKI